MLRPQPCAWRPLLCGWLCWTAPALLWMTEGRALDYLDHGQTTAALQEWAAQHPKAVRLTNHGFTAGQREIWSVELGTGTAEERKTRPGLLVVAGIEGDDLAGCASALFWLQQLPTQQAALLEQVTIYVFPRLNADALDAYFARPRQERITNLSPVDDDHDGLLDEDGPEDLDQDGRITQMRVEHPDGDYILDPDEPRLLLRADPAKGERGRWRLLAEGLDNDQDEAWNEDAKGGVNLNRNFPYRYQFFAPNSGPHPVSETASRALADFLVAHPNVGIVLTFGSADNLLQAPKSEPGGKRPPTAIHEKDAAYYKELGALYRTSLGLKKELSGASHPGAFSDWAYFHRGRMSLAAQAWSPALQLELEKAAARPPEPKTATPPEAKPAEDGGVTEDGAAAEESDKPAPPRRGEKPSGAKRGEAERAALRWFDKTAPDQFLPWKAYPHPDFPERTVEIGGWLPFAQSAPPAGRLEAIVQKHAEFLTQLAGRLPRIAWRKVESKSLGQGVFELIVEVENTGYLPTVLVHGSVTREIPPTRVIVKVEEKQILAGRRISFLPPLAGSGGKAELRYILLANKPFQLEAVSALGGSIARTIHLEEAP